MSMRRRKIKDITGSENSSNSDPQIDYTFDEDLENPFIPRPRNNESPIITRSRALALSLQPEVRMENNSNRSTENSNIAQGNPEASNHNLNVEDLTNRLERVLTMNHNMFMNELSNLKQVLVENSNRNMSSHTQRDFNNSRQNNNQEAINDSFHNRSVNSDAGRSSASSISVRIDKWNISYDGSQDVNDFLFKVDTLRERWNCPADQVVAAFHTFLKGKAEKWFWLFLKQNTNTTYDQLKKAIKKQFGDIDNDCDRIVRMIERRQLPKESFDDYFTDMIGMNSRLSQPMAENKIIELIKNNLRESLGSLLFSYELFSLEHLKDAARRAEKYLSRQQQVRFQKKFVTEIEHSEDIGDKDDEIDCEIAALQHRGFSQKPRKEIDTKNFKCWNCDQIGHSFYDCPLEERKLFCFRCGEKNVTTPRCKNHAKNKSANE